MKRTTISISDKLHESLQAHRGDINISDVCRRALDAEIRDREMQATLAGDLQDTIARYRASKASKSDKAHQLGYEHGYNWAKSLGSYDKLKEQLAVYTNWKDDEHTDYRNVTLLHHEWTNSKALAPTPADAFETATAYAAYVRGWIEGVSDLWKRIRDFVED